LRVSKVIITEAGLLLKGPAFYFAGNSNKLSKVITIEESPYIIICILGLGGIFN